MAPIVKVVTGYIDIPNHPRGANDYRALGEQLLGSLGDVEALVFDSEKLTVQDTWLAGYTRTISNLSHAVADNPEKNSLAYHCVQHEKFTWLAQAAELEQADFYVWIDFGILHLKDVTASVIQNYLSRVENYGHAVVMPGCWPKQREVSHQIPCWRFCGGLISVPRGLMKSFAHLVRGVTARQIAETHVVEWEVNSLARVELLDQIPIQWYKADHNATMFTGLS